MRRKKFSKEEEVKSYTRHGNRRLNMEATRPFDSLDADAREEVITSGECLSEAEYEAKELALLSGVLDRAAKNMKELDFKLYYGKARRLNGEKLNKILGSKSKASFVKRETELNPFYNLLSPERAGYRFSTELVDDPAAKTSLYLTPDFLHCLFKINGDLFSNALLMLFCILRVANERQKASYVEVMDAFIEAKKGLDGYSLLNRRTDKVSEGFIIELERVGLVYLKQGWIYFNVNFFFKGDRHPLLAFLREQQARHEFPFPIPPVPEAEEYLRTKQYMLASGRTRKRPKAANHKAPTGGYKFKKRADR